MSSYYLFNVANLLSISWRPNFFLLILLLTDVISDVISYRKVIHFAAVMLVSVDAVQEEISKPLFFLSCSHLHV